MFAGRNSGMAWRNLHEFREGAGPPPKRRSLRTAQSGDLRRRDHQSVLIESSTRRSASRPLV